ncbi:MAG: DUF6599 family protein [Bacteroidales bacterium]
MNKLNRYFGSMIFMVMLLNPVLVRSQESNEFPLFKTEYLTGSTILTERSFTSESLFGYMNGGAELYLEYGFDRLVVFPR